MQYSHPPVIPKHFTERVIRFVGSLFCGSIVALVLNSKHGTFSLLSLLFSAPTTGYLIMHPRKLLRVTYYFGITAVCWLTKKYSKSKLSLQVNRRQVHSEQNS